MIFFVVIGCVAGTMLANGHPQSLSDLSYLGKKIYVQPNLWSGERVAEYNPKKDLENPEEMGNYAEGDMVMPEVHGRSVIAWQSSRWPGSIIPYEISGNFGKVTVSANFNQNSHKHLSQTFSDPTELALLQQVINEFHVNTCIRFVPRMNQRDYISIGNTKTGCWSNVGRLGGRQNVNLQSPTCVSKPGTPIHELMHAAGFIHEQSRPDRDEYIEIEWENVQKGKPLV